MIAKYVEAHSKASLLLLTTMLGCLFLYPLQLQAQESIIKHLETDVPGQGQIRIHQDAVTTAVMASDGNNLSFTANGRIMKVAGYRVQVYSGGNSRTARQEAERSAIRIKDLFPDLKVYTTFDPPRWLCRVGDFLSIEEADAMMRKLRREGGFREAVIVKESIIVAL